MTREEILAKATPREWLRDGNTIYTLEHAGWRKGNEIFQNRLTVQVSGRGGIPVVEVDATSIMVCAALNSYEKQRDCISGLITVARQVVNTFWETYEYRDKYADNDCTKALEHLEAALARAEELLKGETA